MNDLDKDLTEDIINQLATEDDIAEQFYHLSLNSLSSKDNIECIKLWSVVQNKVLLMLVDSGSSHTFINKTLVATLGLPIVYAQPKQVKLANGQLLLSDRIAPALQWWCQGYTLTTEMKVLDLDVYDVILGYDWLKANSPMQCNWDHRTLEFHLGDRPVKLQGVKPSDLQLTSIYAE